MLTKINLSKYLGSGGLILDGMEDEYKPEKIPIFCSFYFSHWKCTTNSAQLWKVHYEIKIKMWT